MSNEPVHEAEIVPPEPAPSTALAKTDSPPSGAIATQPMPTAAQMRVVEVSEALAPAYAKASSLKLTEGEIAQLTAPFPDEAVGIREFDGLIYITHIFISDRLNRIFKPGRWALIRRREWIDGDMVYAEYVLLIRGCFVGESVGAHQYVATNKKTNYSDALEATAAEALRRICGKRLSCGSQVWNTEYANAWVKKYAYKCGNRWQKNANLGDENPQSKLNPDAPQPPPAEAPPTEVVAEESIEGAVEELNQRPATGGKTRYGIRVGGAWFNHWSSTTQENALSLKGQQVRVTFTSHPQYGKQLKTITPIVVCTTSNSTTS